MSCFPSQVEKICLSALKKLYSKSIKNERFGQLSGKDLHVGTLDAYESGEVCSCFTYVCLGED